MGKNSKPEPKNDDGPCKHKGAARFEHHPGLVDIICVDCDTVIRTDIST